MMNPDGVYLGNYRGSLLGEFHDVAPKKYHVNETTRKKSSILKNLIRLNLWLFVNPVVLLEAKSGKQEME